MFLHVIVYNYFCFNFRVQNYQDDNRMTIPNLAIVFGPTLMWPDFNSDSANMAADLMQQNEVIECLLSSMKNGAALFPD